MKNIFKLSAVLFCALTLFGCGEPIEQPKTFVSVTAAVEEGVIDKFVLELDKEKFKCQPANWKWGCEWATNSKPGFFEGFIGSKEDDKTKYRVAAAQITTGNNREYSFLIDNIYMYGNGKETMFVCGANKKCLIMSAKEISELPPEVSVILNGGEHKPFIPNPAAKAPLKKATWDTAEGKETPPEMVNKQ